MQAVHFHPVDSSAGRSLPRKSRRALRVFAEEPASPAQPNVTENQMTRGRRPAANIVAVSTGVLQTQPMPSIKVSVQAEPRDTDSWLLLGAST